MNVFANKMVRMRYKAVIVIYKRRKYFLFPNARNMNENAMFNFN